jgi:hypothetical protein
MHRHGVLELLLVLPDGSKSLIPAAWTDMKPVGAERGNASETLGALTDLLTACELVADLIRRERERDGGARGQAARMSPCKEDSRAACPTQFDTRSGPDHDNTTAADAGGGDGRAAAHPGGHDGNHVAGRRDSQSSRVENQSRG